MPGLFLPYYTHTLTYVSNNYMKQLKIFPFIKNCAQLLYKSDVAFTDFFENRLNQFH